MTIEQKPHRHDLDQDDQYSQPTCRTPVNSDDVIRLGPNTQQILGVLRLLQNEAE